jgi:hypothetical protein
MSQGNFTAYILFRLRLSKLARQNDSYVVFQHVDFEIVNQCMIHTGRMRPDVSVLEHAPTFDASGVLEQHVLPTRKQLRPINLPGQARGACADLGV